ncbi:alpha/beta fold hydrolase [Streptomyces sp. NBC_01306]|uniref:alpha/beta fold hydrolase n=1 Tax=Streptomyces sp. NBC_01306 TaxID=2903819 RepID=UPI00224D3394|nr:alpha/beta hydrolase [Streptomyces sp. NBC_01306]MCX4722514.1 alpha/beta hydrolase [Streptomyces sp. NBC_01306]
MSAKPAETASPHFRAAYDDALAQWPFPVDSRGLPTPYGLTRINSCGPLAAPPLVLLPGGGATSLVWRAAVAAGLGRTHRVHAVDLVGEPGLSVPAEGRPIRSTGDLDGWLGAVIDGLDATGPVTLAGHSYGAWIAARCRSSRPTPSPGASRSSWDRSPTPEPLRHRWIPASYGYFRWGHEARRR